MAKQVVVTGRPLTISVRQLLEFFWQERRGKYVTRYIRSKLTSLGVETDPPFEDEHIDGIIKLFPREKRGPGRPPKAGKKTPGAVAVVPPALVVNDTESSPVIEENIPVEDSVEDERRSYLPISLLSAANRKPVSVRPGDEIETVVFQLMSEGLAHLPVLRDSRSPEGIITWQSLGKANAGGDPPKTARECLDVDVRVVGLDTPLFDAVRDIIKSGVVLVRNKSNEICGMLTAQDIAEQFVALSEPFLFLEQIENHLRNLLIRAKLSQQELNSFIDPADKRRTQGKITVDDLTFGEYLRAMSKEEVWSRLALRINRKLFIDRMDKVREIRNSVMHFHPDGISDGDRELLAKTREMLQGL
ncbi:MAG: CBS domain-containing protein [Candidatus Hydrogenedentes bacterium]|nr:CBS domain-containing protein [Candidatus Hydrogenedentota bacterium]